MAARDKYIFTQHLNLSTKFETISHKSPLIRTFANSEDPDETQHENCIPPGSALFAKIK